MFVCLSHYYNGCCFQMQNKNKPVTCPSLTSPNFSLKPGDANGQHVIRTQELPHINSSIIQTANQKIMNLQHGSGQNCHKKPACVSSNGAKLPLSLSGLLSPRHTGTKDTSNVQYMSPISGMSTSSPLTQSQLSESALHPSVAVRPVATSASHHSISGLISPARMYPTNFSPHAAQSVQTGQPIVSAPPATPPRVGPGPGTPPKTGLVYLRQDQNIPDNFCDKFRPIEPATGDTNGVDKTEFVDIKNISSDDIVVTLHSVNV